jgi:hypothetical protein
MGPESRRDTWKRSADEAAKEALNEETHHTETYPLQDLIAWIKEKHEQQQQKWENSTTTMKERKPNDDQTRAGCHKPLTHWIYQSHLFCSDGQRTQAEMPLLRIKSQHRPHSMAL